MTPSNLIEWSGAIGVSALILLAVFMGCRMVWNEFE